MRTLLIPALLLAVAACGPAPAPQPLQCNGSEKLCDRRYDQVAYPTTHNAMAVGGTNSSDDFIAFDQHNSMEQQLADGIRAMMLDLHPDMDGTGVWLCHGQCAWGKRSLLDAMQMFKSWLDAHPHEVLSIQFESYVPAPAVAAIFQQAGLIPYVFTHKLGDAWPTLRTMIEANQRLVVFYEDDKDGAGDGAPDWYMPLFQNSFETPFSAQKPEDLKCVLGRGALGHSLFTMNHFLTIVDGSPDLAEQVNHNPFLVDRGAKCGLTFTHIPNFVAVDFYEIGDLFAAVKTLNGL